jgi:hypothetical protein
MLLSGGIELNLQVCHSLFQELHLPNMPPRSALPCCKAGPVRVMLTGERVGCLRTWCGDVRVSLGAVLQAFGDWEFFLELSALIDLHLVDGFL